MSDVVLNLTRNNVTSSYLGVTDAADVQLVHAGGPVGRDGCHAPRPCWQIWRSWRKAVGPFGSDVPRTCWGGVQKATTLTPKASFTLCVSSCIKIHMIRKVGNHSRVMFPTYSQ